MLSQALISSGCFGDGDHFQRLDQRDLSIVNGSKIVFRRSIPHAGKIPNAEEIVSFFESAGYEVEILKIRRNREANLRSMRMRGHATTMPKAVGKYEESQRILDRLDGIEVDYRRFVTEPDYRFELFTNLGLPEPKMVFFDGDAKY